MVWNILQNLLTVWTITLPLPVSHSRHSLSFTIWCPRRCWPSSRTPRTSCWSSLRISVTCSEMPRCTARLSSFPALLPPTTTLGRSREGTERTKRPGIELKYHLFTFQNWTFFGGGHNRAGKLRSRGPFIMKYRSAADVGQPNVREDLKAVVGKESRTTAIAWRRGRSFRT